MTDDTRPPPLVPAEVDLRGYEFMPLYGDRLLKSQTWIAASAEAKVAALRLWWHAYAHEVPAASLPNNDALLADYAGYGVAVKAWQKIKPQVMGGFVECSDGRLYHRRLADWAIAAWELRDESNERRENVRDRQKRHRDERKRMFATLREQGVVPAFDISMEALRETLQATLQGTLRLAPVTRDVTVTATAKTVNLQRSDSDLENRDVERTPDITAQAGDSRPAISKSGKGNPDSGQQWDSPAWVAATAETCGRPPKHPNESDADFRDRVYGAVGEKMRVAEADAKRRAK